MSFVSWFMIITNLFMVNFVMPGLLLVNRLITRDVISSSSCLYRIKTKTRTGNKKQYEPRHDKTNNVAVHPAKTQISLGIRPV